MDNKKTYKIAIVGPPDMVSGFKALGVEVLPAQSVAEARSQLSKVRRSLLDANSDKVYAVVCIIEDLAKEFPEGESLLVGNAPLPAVVILPGPRGSTGYAERRLKKLAEKAIGSAII